ncbi:hypothetical protein LTR84_013033 [Exophiala bonariae]|uniref:Serine hydrolase domain-containing protein n=1 Tax=Exophiala bonariae TaxID=1690606 RepID=A0AAV9NHG7_9EURO|nr:hypothetical protein LTR84_013033 [Exophiala bonariae]
MRFLCLHGRGTNSDIFESQLAALFSRLSPEHSFDFIDAPYHCSAAPGISKIYDGPYLAWHSRYDPVHIAEIHEYIDSVINEDGPYDGVIGFSQGAALAASFLLCHEYTHDQALLDSRHAAAFKVAIFFNSVMLFSPSEDIGADITDTIKKQEEKHMGFLRGESNEQTLPEPQIRFKMPNWSSSSSTSLSSIASVSTISEDEPSDEIKWARKRSVAFESQSLLKEHSVYGFPTDNIPHQIAIPTLHVIGAKDEFSEHSQTLTMLCQREKAEIFLIKDGGHDIPRTKAALDECARLFEMVVMMGSIR